MDEKEYTTLQDDGCPHCSDHIPDWTLGVPFWILNNRCIYVKMHPNIMRQLEERRSRAAT